MSDFLMPLQRPVSSASASSRLSTKRYHRMIMSANRTTDIAQNNVQSDDKLASPVKLQRSSSSTSAGSQTSVKRRNNSMVAEGTTDITKIMNKFLKNFKKLSDSAAKTDGIIAQGIPAVFKKMEETLHKEIWTAFASQGQIYRIKLPQKQILKKDDLKAIAEVLKDVSDVLDELRSMLSSLTLFADEELSTVLQHTITNLKSNASCLHALMYYHDIEGPDLNFARSYVHDIMIDTGNDFKETTRYLQEFWKSSYNSIKEDEKYTSAMMTSLSAVAGLFSATTATTLQMSLNTGIDDQNSVVHLTNCFWFLSLLLSVAVALLVLLLIVWRQVKFHSQENHIPWIILLWIYRLPPVLLAISAVCFSVGLVLFVYSSNQTFFTTTLFAVVFFICALGLCSACLWLAGRSIWINTKKVADALPLVCPIRLALFLYAWRLSPRRFQRRSSPSEYSHPLLQRGQGTASDVDNELAGNEHESTSESAIPITVVPAGMADVLANVISNDEAVHRGRSTTFDAAIHPRDDIHRGDAFGLVPKETKRSSRPTKSSRTSTSNGLRRPTVAYFRAVLSAIRIREVNRWRAGVNDSEPPSVLYPSPSAPIKITDSSGAGFGRELALVFSPDENYLAALKISGRDRSADDELIVYSGDQIRLWSGSGRFTKDFPSRANSVLGLLLIEKTPGHTTFLELQKRDRDVKWTSKYELNGIKHATQLKDATLLLCTFEPRKHDPDSRRTPWHKALMSKEPGFSQEKLTLMSQLS
ncbi:hypothetical protein K474DRAFT_1680000 [Panus rudis PR-1116 ss-1]|nr:hypothetical protein K474DRAFT_1680000 [Panus rudis PR-1116 ss-1]